ncbi:phosphatidylinositol-4,5-diphosphate 3-kinase [Reticulomyxa filosa]|uniref:Phosphatidylinositol-4,5-diphosphate 3-kinase n=1 Tax=Reticulomyxa filosa TaxID=46433 RepID=X6N8K8_RETFI|nr:phosphatidylinositol-4,5-diphosphate 3-kinase [Reticulomyxa filosa]|eukprot:ETO22243.1 phosphatidylinositol-4,5-diphosphate 3-kinase [Reticulomyxa filosa]
MDELDAIESVEDDATTEAAQSTDQNQPVADVSNNEDGYTGDTKSQETLEDNYNNNNNNSNDNSAQGDSNASSAFKKAAMDSSPNGGSGRGEEEASKEIAQPNVPSTSVDMLLM